LAAGQDIWPLF